MKEKICLIVSVASLLMSMCVAFQLWTSSVDIDTLFRNQNANTQSIQFNLEKSLDNAKRIGELDLRTISP